MLEELARKEKFMSELEEKLKNRQKENENEMAVLIGFNKDVSFTMHMGGYDENGKRVYLYNKVFMTLMIPYFKDLLKIWELNEIVDDFTTMRYMFSDEIKEKYSCVENAMKEESIVYENNNL